MNDPVTPSGNAKAQIQSKSRHERVGADEDGQRVDNFLIKRCAGVPRSHIYRLIRTGEIRVDGRRVKQTRKLVIGEQVRIPAIKVTVSDVVQVPDKLADAAGASVLLEHDDFLIVNKPPGIAVHAGTGLAFGFIDALRQNRQEPRLELAHRLDRATSGCLLVGRTMASNRRLQDLFRQRSVTKRYTVVVDGRWPESVTQIDAPLLKNVEHAGERRVTVDAAGQPALTRVAVAKRYREATELEVHLDTGRTHQIRVHSLHTGHAVIGDQRYGDNARNAYFKKRGLSRLYLHSTELAFAWKNKPISVVASVDSAWKTSLEKAFG